MSPPQHLFIWGLGVPSVGPVVRTGERRCPSFLISREPHDYSSGGSKSNNPQGLQLFERGQMADAGGPVTFIFKKERLWVCAWTSSVVELSGHEHTKCEGRVGKCWFLWPIGQGCPGPYCALWELEKAPLAQDVLLPSAGKLSWYVNMLEQEFPATCQKAVTIKMQIYAVFNVKATSLEVQLISIRWPKQSYIQASRQHLVSYRGTLVQNQLIACTKIISSRL